MLKASFECLDKNLRVLCLGAHPDDIEIGCGGTLLKLAEEKPDAEFFWVVFSGNEQRRQEAVDSANSFVNCKKMVVKDFRESFFPYCAVEIKDFFEELKREFSPDLVFTHFGKDFHQDHQLISNLTWNTFRNHLIFEYEIPKYDGDLVTPNVYVGLPEGVVNKKISHLMDSFKSQSDKFWFTEETFRSLLRIRGIECNSPSGYAEGFHCRKILF